MGTYPSNYPMISEENRGTSVPHFAWFHPGNYMAAMRNGMNPFQGSRHNTEEITLIPNSSIPINNVEAEPQPDKPAKKAKTSRKNPNDGTDTLKERKPKKSRKSSSNSPKARRGRKNASIASCESSMDGTLSPFCSCTGTPRQCYRWGSGGWQSACCTINISEYPLPMNATRPGSRTAGRKMSHGAFVKLLQRLASEGYDLSNAIDLKDHWARHGTNKFVIIK
ncbi:uncharacterized protein LOC141593389 [Silene latifolia]|uniref:uncharacterized protein LOC141593389 n=1 Tax=Silene latifolia TaxID=37657 RepID=UPI003D770D7A